MRKLLCTIFALLMLLLPLSLPQAEAASKSGWDPVYKHIEKMVNDGVATYEKGDIDGAKKLINDSYYAVYETDGLEKAIRTTLSSKNANATEYQYTKLKGALRDQKPQAEVKAEADKLLSMMREDIKKLKDNGGGGNRWASFWPAFLIIMREGLEAVLMLVAIMAYLVKTGNSKYLDTIYNYANMAIMASFGTAFVIKKVLGAAAGGVSKEYMEAITAFLAVAVLLSACIWLHGKTNAAEWKRYVENLVKKGINNRRANALGMAAFLAVYREGAEIILFFQALFNSSSADTDMIWYGCIAGFVLLLVILFVMQAGLVHIPLRPFFIVTTIFMFVLAISFTGSGINEFQAIGVIPQTLVPGFPSIDAIGIYPYVENLSAQLALILLGVAIHFYQKHKAAKAAAAEA